MSWHRTGHAAVLSEMVSLMAGRTPKGPGSCSEPLISGLHVSSCERQGQQLFQLAAHPGATYHLCPGRTSLCLSGLIASNQAPTTCALVFKVCAEKGGRGDRPDMVINAWDSAFGRWTLEELV